MDKELKALIRDLDKYISNGYLVVDFQLDKKVKNIFKNWLVKKELTTYAPLVGDEFDCYLMPKKDVEQLGDAIPMRIKRFSV